MSVEHELAIWIETDVIAEHILGEMEDQGVRPTLENAKTIWHQEDMQMLRIEHLKNKSTHSGGMGRHMSAGATGKLCWCVSPPPPPRPICCKVLNSGAL
jgi:hypothetical protein